MCTHTNTRIQRHPYVCTISIAVCACIARRLLLDVGALRFCFAFGCPANKIQNTKKKLYFFSLPRSFLLAALYLFGFSACGLVSLASSLACFVHFYAFALFVISLSAISTLALSHAVAAVLSLSSPLTLPLIIHWTNDSAPLCPTQTQKHIPLLYHSPLFVAHSFPTLFGRFARRRYVQFQPPKAENQ